ncbi:hypothetical protein V8E53_012613 [Lactarius tabidus]
MSRPIFNFFPSFFRLFSSRPSWKRIAWDTQEKLLKSERRRHESEKVHLKLYFEERIQKLRFEDKIGILQRDLLRLRNNFNLCGALEYSLEAYRDSIKASHASKTFLLEQLTKDKDYQKCLMDVSCRLQLREADVNACTRVLYHELSKHAHGNTEELIAHYNEHTMTEIAAIEAVFCALKTKHFFHIPLKIITKNHEHNL